jgi:hypothetical protein
VFPPRDAVTRGPTARARPAAVHGRNEPIAFAHDRLHESGLAGVVAERLADLPHRGVDRGIALDEHVPAPQCRLNPAAIDECAGVLDQQHEHLHRDLLEAHARAVLPQRERGDIEFEDTETEAATHQGE